MELMELLVIAYAPLVARFHLIDGPAASHAPTRKPQRPRAKRGFRSGDLRAAIGRRTLGLRWRNA